MPQYENTDDEVLQRTRRIETRLMKLCAFLGFDPGRDRDRVIVESESPVVLDISGLDVSLGDLFDACRKSGISGPVTVKHKGVLVAAITVKEDNATHRPVLVESAKD